MNRKDTEVEFEIRLIASPIKLHTDNISIFLADFIFWDINKLEEIPYWFDSHNKIKKIFKNGLEVYKSS